MRAACPYASFSSKNTRIESLYCFENRWPTVFPAVDNRFKFITFSTRKGGETEGFKCAFMQHDPERLASIENDAIIMPLEVIPLFAPGNLNLMEFKSQPDLMACRSIYKDSVLLSYSAENSWECKFERELQDNGADFIHDTAEGHRPLIEGKCIHQFDYNYSAPTNFFDERAYRKLSKGKSFYSDRRLTKKHDSVVLNCSNYRLVLRRQASSTNERTLICSMIQPGDLCGDNLEVIIPSNINETGILLLCGILNSFVADFIIRNKVTTNLNKFFLYQIPVPELLHRKNGTLFATPIACRVARLTCVTHDFAALWNENFSQSWRNEAGKDGQPYGPAHEQALRERMAASYASLTATWCPDCAFHDRRPDRRDDGDRAQTRAEIDALVAHLYTLTRDEFAYILDTFPGLRRKEIAAFGEYQSKRKALEEYERLAKR